jgi:hypothetical protein
VQLKLTVDQVNYLNIGLMLLSAAAAFARPFELFLFVYAFLGPLHYLTEISWLHDKNYFTQRKGDSWALVAMAVLITLTSVGIPSGTEWLGPVITCFAFGAALVFVTVRGATPRAFSLCGVGLLAILLLKTTVAQSVFGIMLPTIVHVSLFTAIFILIGALRARSASGIASLVVFTGCVVAFFFVSPAPGRPITNDTKIAYTDFAVLNYALVTPIRKHALNVPGNTDDFVRYINHVLYQSPAAFAIMAFIAFSYTYHYLNWFSKTSVIRWHNIPRSRFAAVIGIWIASIALYLWNYTVGIRWLLFLSLTHVLLEFPLDHLTFINIGKELRGFVVRREASVANSAAIVPGKSPGKGGRPGRRVR